MSKRLISHTEATTALDCQAGRRRDGGRGYYFKRGTPFWDRVAVGGPDECWEWLALRHPKGYGQVTVNGRRIYAHRHAYELVKGPIPKGLLARHTCDNPPCCNPAHLIVGTVADNAQDAVERGRVHRPAGELHGQHKFTDEQVAEARRLSASGLSNLEVAERTGISSSYVCRLVRDLRR